MQLPGKRGMSLQANGAVGVSIWAPFMWRVLAVLVIGALLAHWTWVVFAPRSAQVLPAMLPASGFQAEHLFGITAVSSVAVQAALPNVRLVGVFAGVPGFAIMELDGKRQVGLATGHEIVSGAKLVEVAIDHVVIERNGVRQQIRLAEKESVINSLDSMAQAIPLTEAAVAVIAASAAKTEPNTNVAPNMTRSRGGL
jgi:type II secretory pathway component PulC